MFVLHISFKIENIPFWGRREVSECGGVSCIQNTYPILCYASKKRIHEGNQVQFDEEKHKKQEELVNNFFWCIMANYRAKHTVLALTSAL